MSHPATPSTEPLAPGDLVEAYLDRFYLGDHAAVRDLLADDFSFSGPFVAVQGADAYLASAAGLRTVTRGHTPLRRWIDGADVCSIHDVALCGPGGEGVVTMSEWHTVADGRLRAARVLFDSPALRAILTPPQGGDRAN